MKISFAVVIAVLTAQLSFGQTPIVVAPPIAHEAPSPSVKPNAERWDFKCIGSEKAGVKQNWGNEDLDKEDGWNAFIKKMTDEGWEPSNILYFSTPVTTMIHTVCFRRPRAR